LRGLDNKRAKNPLMDSLSSILKVREISMRRLFWLLLLSLIIESSVVNLPQKANATAFALQTGPQNSNASADSNSSEDKFPVRLKATIPDYKGPSVYNQRRAQLVYSPDGQTLAISSKARTVKLYDAHTGQLKFTLKGGKDGLNGFAFSPDGRTLATLDFIDKTVRLWDASTGESKATLAGRKRNFETKFKAGMTSQLDPSVPFVPLSFSPDGQAVLTEREDDVVDLWETETGKLRATLEHDTRTSAAKDVLKLILLPGKVLPLMMMAVYSPDGRLIATANGDKLPKLWDAATGQLKMALDGHRNVYWVQFSKDGRTLATTSTDGIVNLWDTETGQLRATLGRERKFALLAFEFSADGKAAVTFFDKETSVWDVATGKLKWTQPKTKVTDASFSPDGRMVAIALEDKGATAKLLDAETGEVRLTLAASDAKPESIAFSPDGRIIVTTSSKGLKLWNAASGELLSTLGEARYPASFSPDSQTLATGGRNDTAMLWEIPARR
jgi:WD40 repeat protein